MAVLMGAVSGVFFNFNFFIAAFSVLSGIFIFINIDNKWKYFTLCILLFTCSFFNASFRNMNYYSNNQIIQGDFKVKDARGNSYILRKGLSTFKAYIKGRYREGDLLHIKGEVLYFPESMNEYGFNSRKYNKARDIDYKLKIEKAEIVSEGGVFSNIKNSFIKYVNRVLNRFLSSENADFMKSIILADRDYIDSDMDEIFRKTGMSHILAVSGLHISVIMLFADFVLSVFSIHKVARRVISIVFTGLYIVLINMPVGAVRAYIMTVCLFMDFIVKRKYNSLDALLLSAIILILCNPFIFYSLSFIFSYLAVLSIILFLKTFEAVLPDNFIGKSIALCIAVNILIFPVSMYFFYSFSLITFISNILMVPVLSVAIVLSFLSIVFMPAAFILEPFLNLILNMSIRFIGFLSQFDFMNISLKIFTQWDLMIYYLIVFMVYNLSKTGFLFEMRNFIILSLIILSAVYFIFNYDDSLIADFLYVDQGDSCLVSYKGRNYLIDTGGSHDSSYRPGRIYTLNYLRRHGIYSIDGLFISHFDADHCDGVKDIEEYVNIKNVYVSHLSENDILDGLLEKGKNVFLLKKGDVLKVAENSFFKVVSDSQLYDNENDKSMVLELFHKNRNILFTGDISGEVEKNIDGEYNILKVAHHGSRFSSSSEFLRKISPEYAIISSGINNRYNHPHSETVKKLKKSGAKIFATSSNGQIRVRMSDDIEIIPFSEVERSLDFIIVNILAFLIFYLLFYRMRELWNIEKYTVQI